MRFRATTTIFAAIFGISAPLPAKCAEDGTVRFLMSLAQRESGNRKTIENEYGFLGLYQMGGAALADAGFYKLGSSGRSNAWDGKFTARAAFVDVTSKETYLEFAGSQELAVRAYHEMQWMRMSKLGLSTKVGSNINGITITKSGLIAGSHLVGIGGVARFVRSNGTDDPSDANGTLTSSYIKKFGGYF